MQQFSGYLELADWRRSVTEMYRSIRQIDDPVEAWSGFIHARNTLFKHHLQSPLDSSQRTRFSSLDYFDYDPSFRIEGRLSEPPVSAEHTYDLGDDGSFRMRRIALIHFRLAEAAFVLNLYWIEGYAGGLFLPFKDRTSGRDTYGGGRYLLDSIKGADLGISGDTIILDFNFAYNPSCAYHDRWVCPLPPAENQLGIEVRAGEKDYNHE